MHCVPLFTFAHHHHHRLPILPPDSTMDMSTIQLMSANSPSVIPVTGGVNCG